MSDNIFKRFAALPRDAIYPKLASAAQIAGIDRHVSWGQVVIAPIYGAYAKEGAEKFLATLIYPDSMKDRLNFINILQAKQIKNKYPPRSDGRKEIRKQAGELLDIPNKRIEQGLQKAMAQLNKRNRAAWVLWNKLASSPNPDKQDDMRALALRTSLCNSDGQTQYGKRDDYGWVDEDNTERAFRAGVMEPARPVAHMAMAFYAFFEGGGSIDLLELTLHSEWLQPVMICAEIIRLSFGDMFPSSSTNRISHRRNNYGFDMSNMISVLPYINSINTADDHAAYIQFLKQGNAF